eukprot:CAMPEP_0182849672 /NCGR_PEP_ID=MMETSP0006_2-20121128/29685_1 /TAXON_ID=97485 /ORGANISM="Prymnesium parvum, Strain Texoma1" /LENGTH=177 /DNA_ID=CAMNT_0024980225 /DNA_START=265 /DNA_END=799 /DNA_ORIENTATION=-
MKHADLSPMESGEECAAARSTCSKGGNLLAHNSCARLKIIAIFWYKARTAPMRPNVTSTRSSGAEGVRWGARVQVVTIAARQLFGGTALHACSKAAIRCARISERTVRPSVSGTCRTSTTDMGATNSRSERKVWIRKAFLCLACVKLHEYIRETDAESVATERRFPLLLALKRISMF